jgi:hypothetical protein
VLVQFVQTPELLEEQPLLYWYAGQFCGQALREQLLLVPPLLV